MFTPRKLISGTVEWPQNGICDTEVHDELGMGNSNYRRPNMVMGNSNGTDNAH